MNATFFLRARRGLIPLSMLLAAGVAQAHPGHGAHGLTEGLAHPLGLDHLLAMVAVGMWSAAALPARRALMGPAVFVLALLAGAAAGLAAVGKIPLAGSYALFTERGFEITRNSICLPNLNVKIIVSHGGLTIGSDGATHQAVEDLAIMRSLTRQGRTARCGEGCPRRCPCSVPPTWQQCGSAAVRPCGL